MIILLGLGVPAVLCGLGVAAYQYISGEGKVRLVAPGDAELSYSLDGNPMLTLAKGGSTLLKLQQGKPTLALESSYGKTQRVVDVQNGFADLLVPADDGQCFVVLDVSRSHFQHGSKTPDEYPGIKARVKSSDVYDLPGSSYFTEASLPSSLKEGSACNLVQEVECKLLDEGDAELRDVWPARPAPRGRPSVSRRRRPPALPRRRWPEAWRWRRARGTRAR